MAVYIYRVQETPGNEGLVTWTQANSEVGPAADFTLIEGAIDLQAEEGSIVAFGGAVIQIVANITTTTTTTSTTTTTCLLYTSDAADE